MLNDNFITKVQPEEIDSIITEHTDAVTAIGAILYAKGYSDGYGDAVKHCYIAIGIGCVIGLGIEAAKSLKKRHENKKSIVIKKD